ncbi:hypothetical protein LCGC14_1536180 [marine sediment metagenome]|uniref:Uncharacterized protein n=1 Tax=marine sediment metagenome TaxID=412755 RepID=A0A0F9JFC2_9ZZZZ
MAKGKKAKKKAKKKTKSFCLVIYKKVLQVLAIFVIGILGGYIKGRIDFFLKFCNLN